MSSVNTYLTFNGNCREAMIFYQKCLGGELFFQTVGESPRSEKMPKKMKDCILHSTLTNGSLLLMGSDIVAETGLIKGNAVSLILDCNNEKEIKSCYKKLSEGAKATYPLVITFGDSKFGALIDKFGINWMFNYSKKIPV